MSRSYSESLEQRRNIQGFLIQPQLFFFGLRAEHRHAVGEFVAFGADVGGDVGEIQFFLDTLIDRITGLDNF